MSIANADPRIVAPNGEPVESFVLQVGKPCPHCGADGAKVQGCFGGGVVCMRCGAQETP